MYFTSDPLAFMKERFIGGVGTIRHLRLLTIRGFDKSHFTRARSVTASKGAHQYYPREAHRRRVDVVEFIEICKAVEADPNKLLKVLIQRAA
jgi:hypothetical protein